MASKIRSIKDEIQITNHENDSNPKNSSHKSNIPHNFNLKTITLSDCDQAVYNEFNKRFKVAGNAMPLILLDAELLSIKEENITQLNEDKEYLRGPFFTMIRTESKPKYRTNPANKKTIYSVPKLKKNGVVIEDYIYNGTLSYDLFYEFKFISGKRISSNEFEEQMRAYFKNKRNIIVCSNERFSISPVDFNNFSKLDIQNIDSINQKTYYISTYELKLECFIRDLSDMQKRERPNKFQIDFQVANEKGVNSINTQQTISLNKS